ncbi:MAG: hypothetical protein IT378_17710 [Sandaracinaceae bacterium]|nr:hypothetical protein [Sandaracinaceae bacterium]
MLIVFEIYVQPMFEPDELLSPAVQKETGARIFTRDEAEAAGLSGLPQPSPDHGEVRYILVNANHRRWIERAIEASSHVGAFNVHDIG